MVFQHPTLFGGMHFVLMISAIQILISCLATESMVCSLLNPQFYALAPWTPRLLPLLERLVPRFLDPFGALTENPIVEVDSWLEPYLCSTADRLLTFYTLQYALSTTSYPWKASLSANLVIQNPWAILTEKCLLRFFHYPHWSCCTVPKTD